MKLSQLVAAVSIAIAAGSFSAVVAAEHGSIDKVLGSASVGSNEHYSDISLVNGSLQMASNSSAKNISLVNGSIELRDQVRIDSAATVNGSIESGEGLNVVRDLSTVNGKIYPGRNAVIGGNIETVNGDIRLNSSKVHHNVVTVNGDISLDGNTVVKGDVVYKPRGKRKMFFGWSNDNTPTLHIGADVVIEGRIILQQKVALQFDNPALQDKVDYQFNDSR